MKRITGILVFTMMTGLACAGEMENVSVSGALSPLNLSAMKDMRIPTPEVPTAVKTAVSPWVKAVKTAYEKLLTNNEVETLPKATAAELPKAALKQQQKDNAQFAPDFPSVAYKLQVQGKTAFVIQNNNDGGMLVNIFDKNGEHIAYGGQSESEDFMWMPVDSSKGVPAADRKKLAHPDNTYLGFSKAVDIITKCANTSPLNLSRTLDELGVGPGVEECVSSSLIDAGAVGCNYSLNNFADPQPNLADIAGRLQNCRINQPAAKPAGETTTSK